MRVGVGVGPVRVSENVGPTGCLVLVWSAVALVVIGGAVALGERHPVEAALCAVATLVCLIGLGALALKFRRDGRRVHQAMYAGQYCTTGGPHQWQHLGWDAQRRAYGVCAGCGRTTYSGEPGRSAT